MKLIVPDTSILIQEKLSELIREGKLTEATLIIPRAVLDELQAQASTGKDIGFRGLEEIKRLRELAKTHSITVELRGDRPTLEEIQLAKKGRIDAIIRDVARKEGATLLTGDYVQALVGEVEGLSVEHIPRQVSKVTKLEGFFDDQTQSVHLKVGVVPMAKKGRPGEVQLVKLGKKLMEEDELRNIIDDVVTKARREDGSFIEFARQGALVVQLGNYRIAIAKPPFSDGLELTAVRPIAKVSLADYKLHKDLEERLTERSEGMLIAGPPGAGKTSFAAAIAEFLASKGKIVKTFEQPRDLQVGPEITQYAPLEGDWVKTSEILLLVRPDYTIFDEVRKTYDFKVFGDMRLSGVGMIGVVHATSPVAAIQRFIGRLELGIIPHVIDTVVYVEAGRIAKVLEVSLVVKVPTGMTEADLARPVVEIRDFATKILEYEIYSYGDENVIIPIKEERSPLKELALERISQELQKYDPNVKIDVAGGRIIARVKNDIIARLIGKKGANIEQLERKLGMHISVEPVEETLKQQAAWQYEERGSNILLYVEAGLAGEQVDIYSGDEYALTVHVGHKGQIKIRKKSPVGKKVLRGIASQSLRVMV
ncbi:MAG: Flp pilus assembly complex ATPase component TadA [Candidatus Aenigmarchaeota archaeon]|nr:Flp pilus assembly complex ATPase component TadA [Candidatus Aenigmarchaeota archaeon]